MTAVILIAALAGLIWGALFVLRGSLPAGCLVFLLAAVCFGHEFLEFDLGPVPLTIDRLVMVLLVVAFMVQSRLGRTSPKPLNWVDGVLIAFGGLLAASTFAHDWRVVAAGEISPVWRLIFGYMMPIALYLIARQSPWGERQLTFVHGSLACFGVYLAITGLAEVSQQWWLVFPKYIADEKIGIHFGRARGPMVQAAAFGTWLALCLLSLWVWRERFGRPGRLLLLLLIPLYLAAIFFTYTRSAWGETGLGLLIAFCLTLQGRLRTVVVGSMIAAGLLVAVAKWDTLRGFQREHSAADARKSGDMRVSFAYVSWKMFQDRPLLGCGFGHYRTEVLPYLSDRSSELDLEALRGYVHHNTPLCILSENGIIGLALYVALLFGWSRMAWQLLERPTTPTWARRHAVLMLATLAVYVVQILSRDITYTAVENMLVFFYAGITAGLRPLGETAASRSSASWPVLSCADIRRPQSLRRAE